MAGWLCVCWLWYLRVKSLLSVRGFHFSTMDTTLLQSATFSLLISFYYQPLELKPRNGYCKHVEKIIKIIFKKII